jgi:GntR family transcriptional regulator
MKKAPRKLVVSEGNRTPLYHQLFLILKGKILAEEFNDGRYLPGEHQLAAEYGVSRITATRALKELALAGLVERRRGKGTQIRHALAADVRRGPIYVTGPVSGSSPIGRLNLLDFSYISATSEIAGLLGVIEGSKVQRAIRVRYVTGKPYGYLLTYIPAAIGKNWTKAQVAKTPMRRLLQNHGHEVDRIEEAITAVLAEPQIANGLDVEVGSPLLRIVRISFNQNNQVIEALVGFYPPGRYEYRATLKHNLREVEEL